MKSVEIRKDGLYLDGEKIISNYPKLGSLRFNIFNLFCNKNYKLYNKGCFI